MNEATALPLIDVARLRRRLETLNRFGTTPDRPGVSRESFSPADMAARQELLAIFRARGLQAWMDPVGNVFGRWEVGDGPAVLLGSHLDSVPQGGALDGVLGVVAALECVESLQEAGREPPAPVEIVATSEEEGRFGGMLGAQAIAGLVDRDWFTTAVDNSGLSLSRALRGAGLDPDALPEAARDPGDVKAFLELHIEQGPVLDRSGRSVGIVDGISGVFNWSVVLQGEANHAGTTPMHLRRDSFRGLVAFAAELPAIIEAFGSDLCRLTIGKVELHPNFPHTVPGRTEFSLIGRDIDLAAMSAVATECRRRLEAMAREQDLDLDLHQASWLPPVPCDPSIVAAFQRQARQMGVQAPLMPSGAGHDTQVLAGFTRAGMIFVPSTGGVSHAPEEHTDWAHVETGCNLLLRTLWDVAGGCA